MQIPVLLLKCEYRIFILSDVASSSLLLQEKQSSRNCDRELQLHLVHVQVLCIIVLNGFLFELHESRIGTVVIVLPV